MEPMGSELLGGLLDRHAAALELFARQHCACPQDVVQEAFVELAGLTRLPEDTVGWLYGVVRHKALSAARAAARRRHHEAEAAGRRRTWFAASPADALDARAAVDALEELSQENREVVIARLWGGLTFQQIAQLVGTTDSAAHRRYEAALRSLRERMKIPCPENR